MKATRWFRLAKYFALGTLVACGALAASSQQAGKVQPGSPQQADNPPKPPILTPGKHFDRVLVIVLENQDYTSAMRDPFLAKMATWGASFSKFKNLYHPSYPNYLAMIAGSSFGSHSDNQVTFPDDPAHPTIADLLDWKAYAEEYPSTDQPFLRDRTGKYVRKHLPFLSFQKIQKTSFRNVVGVNTKDPHNAFVTDVEMFRKDPKKNPLPRYMFYAPNMDDDGHDPYFFPGKGLRKASTWLENFLKTWFPWGEKEMKGTLVVVTFDESESHNSDDLIYTVFLGDMVKNPQVVSKEYNHYSVLRTIEDNFGVGPLNKGDGDADVITEVWK
ncbi:MAG TPA: alkaline phosphatase family protein [Candidatus Dormibacteraeota bacterium]|nr:alkaline phosphatase family protein [Candidatus Dormibacteraeota bacterium]